MQVYILKRFSLVVLFIFIIGCSHPILTTKPNTTYLYNIPSIAQFLPHEETRSIKKTATSHEERVHQLFEKVFKFDQEFAIELGRLPEFQDGVNEREILALENFVNFLSVSTDNDKAALGKILSIGKPKYRQFSSPLQALFWLAEKRELKREKNPLQDYCLDKLLSKAWTFTTEFSEEEAIAIIGNLKNKEKVEEILKRYRNGEISLNELNQWFNTDRSSDEKILEALYHDKKIFSKYKGKDKWSDFSIVVDRLNSPELVDYYQRKNFRYQYRRDPIGSAYQIFKTKSGQCADYTEFAVWCLKKAGYNAFEYHVPSPTRDPYHIVCRFEDKGKWFIMDNGRPFPFGIIEAKKYREGY